MSDRPNPGLVAFWNGLIFLNRLARGKPASAKEEADLHGWSGAVNVEFPGPDGGIWHLLVEDGRSWLRRGNHPSPRATIRLDIASLFRMVVGEVSIFSLQMTGAVTTEGEGLSTIMLWSVIARVKSAGEAGGLVGVLARLWLGRVLRLSGTGLELGAKR